MARLKRVGGWPAILVAVLALVAAAGGTAIADQATTAKKDKLTTQERKKVKKLFDNRLGKAESGLDVNSAKTADTATNAANATNADTAANATNADKVDGADVCNGTIVVPAGATQTLCSSGPLSVLGACIVNPTETTLSVSVATSEDAAWYQGGEDSGSSEDSFGETFFTAADSPTEVANEVDSSASPTDADAISVEISMGHTGSAGASIAGRFGAQANHTGPSQGECRFASGAIAG